MVILHYTYLKEYGFLLAPFHEWKNRTSDKPRSPHMPASKTSLQRTIPLSTSQLNIQPDLFTLTTLPLCRDKRFISSICPFSQPPSGPHGGNAAPKGKHKPKRRQKSILTGQAKQASCEQNRQIAHCLRAEMWSPEDQDRASACWLGSKIGPKKHGKNVGKRSDDSQSISCQVLWPRQVALVTAKFQCSLWCRFWFIDVQISVSGKPFIRPSCFKASKMYRFHLAKRGSSTPEIHVENSTSVDIA